MSEVLKPPPAEQGDVLDIYVPPKGEEYGLATKELTARMKVREAEATLGKSPTGIFRKAIGKLRFFLGLT